MILATTLSMKEAFFHPMFLQEGGIRNSVFIVDFSTYEDAQGKEAHCDHLVNVHADSNY